MMLNLKRQSLVHQISLTAALVSMGIFAVLIGFTNYLAERSALAKTEEELQNQIKGIAQVLELSHRSANAQGLRAMARLKEALGPLHVGPDKLGAGKYQLTAVRSGDRLINGNTALLQSLSNQIGADSALLVREGSEFVRAATLLKDKDGRSMEGLPIPPESDENRALLAGQTYSGVVKRSGKFYLLVVEPIKNASGEVVAALSSRVNVQNEIDELFKSLREVRSGKTGYTYVLAPNKELAKTEMIFHPTLAGKQLGEINNTTLTRIVEEQIQRKQGTISYEWKRSPDSTEMASKMVVFDQVPAWGWIVATGSFIDEFTAEARTLRNTLIGLCLGGAALMSLVLYLITRSRLAPITELLAFTQRVGEGDLSVKFPQVPANSRNELDMITLSLDINTKRIGALIADVIRTAAEVKQASRQLRQDSDEVLAGSTTQSESAAALAAAIEELSVSITHVSDSADIARNITQQAQSHANDGSQQVRRMVDGMHGIANEISQASQAVNLLSERSARISNIGKIINDIADQTNLLALNAAIEAARAGESGRGFAVVADEVRKLAERTASSTREISVTVSEVQTEADRVVQMIQGISDGMQAGVQLAGNSGSMLETIRDESLRTTSAVNDIADATREQSTASQEVARGVEHIAQMADHNNQTTRRTHQQTSRLESLADELENKASHFKV
ncbi:MAG: methyl-accepting chemotaxis protein [Zoogloea sp.]|uniref:methyl-accepting chemotaxis protein n=1 Tax=Zoogloea sp. TaxID=49181 RepID=UPI003F362A53